MRSLRDLITHKPPCDLETCPDGVIPLARRGARSQSRHPTTRQSGCVGPYLALWTPLLSTPQRADNVGSGMGVSWAARRGAAAGLVGRCQIWTNGADLRGAERGNCMPQYKTAQSRRNVREPAGVPPWAGAGFKNFGHQLGKKTKQRFRAPPVPTNFQTFYFLKSFLLQTTL